jgi:hypothetical protein
MTTNSRTLYVSFNNLEKNFKTKIGVDSEEKKSHPDYCQPSRGLDISLYSQDILECFASDGDPHVM